MLVSLGEVSESALIFFVFITFLIHERQHKVVRIWDKHAKKNTLPKVPEKYTYQECFVYGSDRLRTEQAGGGLKS